MEHDGTMTYESAVQRIEPSDPPDFWIGDLDRLAERMAAIERGTVHRLTESPGGRPIDVITYGDREERDRQANFNSAVAAGDPGYFVDRAARDRPVVLFVGPVHGAEVEGLTGLVNLVETLETGTDLRGASHPTLRELCEQCRLLVLPVGNPDGLARVDVPTLNGMTEADLRFWGQGTWSDDTFMGWPEAKQRHPMVGENVGFLGGYFNDDGVNPMHDEFFAPMGPESKAILDLARDEAPDVAVSLHSYEGPPAVFRPSHLPVPDQRAVQAIQREYNDLLAAADLPHSDVFEVSEESAMPPASLNLTGALYHTSGARSFTHESPHGLRDDDACSVSLEEILDAQLCLYEAVLRESLDPSR